MDPQFSEVDLGLVAFGVDLQSPPCRAGADHAIGQIGHPVFVDQPGQDPNRHVPLFTRSGEIGPQHLIDCRGALDDFRLLAEPRAGFSVTAEGQRLSHRPPMQTW